MKCASSLVHLASVLQQSNVRQDRAKPVVGMRLIVLQRKSALEFSNCLQVLEISRWSPEKKSTSDVPLGQIRIEFERAAAMKLRFLEPSARRTEFEVLRCADDRQGGVRQCKCRIARDRTTQMLCRFVQRSLIARRTQPIAAHELRVGHGILAVAGTVLRC